MRKIFWKKVQKIKRIKARMSLYLMMIPAVHKKNKMNKVKFDINPQIRPNV